jgi:hypothetical protein
VAPTPVVVSRRGVLSRRRRCQPRGEQASEHPPAAIDAADAELAAVDRQDLRSELIVSYLASVSVLYGVMGGLVVEGAIG